MEFITHLTQGFMKMLKQTNFFLRRSMFIKLECIILILQLTQTIKRNYMSICFLLIQIQVVNLNLTPS